MWFTLWFACDRRAPDQGQPPPPPVEPAVETGTAETGSGFWWDCSPGAVAEVVGVGVFPDLGSALAELPHDGAVWVCPGEHQGPFTIAESGVVRSREGAAATTLRGAPGSGAEVVRAEDFPITLDGFTVTGGELGGIVTGEATELTVRSCEVTGNVAGGIVLGRLASLTLDATSVTANVAPSGGGIHGGAYLRLVGSSIVGNTAEAFGGGVAYATRVEADPDSRVADNSAPYGGNVFLHAPATWSGGTVEGGAASNGGGFLLWANYAEPASLDDVVIRWNTATFGGGVSIEGPTAQVTGGAIEGNSAEHGGGLRVYGSNVTLDGVRVAGNVATAGGAGEAVLGFGSVNASAVDWGITGVDGNRPNLWQLGAEELAVDGVGSFSCALGGETAYCSP